MLGQVKISQVGAGQISQVKSTWARSGQDRTGQVKITKTGQVNVSHIRPGQVGRVNKSGQGKLSHVGAN